MQDKLSKKDAKQKLCEQSRETHNPVPSAMEVRDLNNRLFFRLLQVANVMHNSASQAVETLGLTSQQWSVLGSIARFEGQGGATVNDLSAHLRMSRQNLSKLLQRLERDGLTQRVSASHDLRQRYVIMTGNGQAIWKSLQKIAVPFHESALQGFSLAERIRFLEFITRLEKGMMS